MRTKLRQKKADAYAVKVELEERVVFQASSPHTIAWDLANNRLLYHRGDWHYTVIKGTETIYDFGQVYTRICQLPFERMPLTDVAQGTILATVAADSVTANSSFAGPRFLEPIAVDAASGNFVAYHHLDPFMDPPPDPFKTFVHGFGPAGGIIALASFAQPPDNTPRWSVPHVVFSNGWVFAIERDEQDWFDVEGVATGRVVRRGIGTLGALIHSWSPEDRYMFPHSLVADPENGVVYVACTKRYQPGVFHYERSFLVELDFDTLAELGRAEINFGFHTSEDPPDVTMEKPYNLGAWEAVGTAQSGGTLILDGPGPTFLGSMITPNGFSLFPGDPRPQKIVRWSATGDGGTFVDELGDALGIPIFRYPTGVIGADYQQLPEIVES